MISIFDLFKIGIGPSSSHTVGPMKAANLFVNVLVEQGLLEQITQVKTVLYGSLGATGRGHASDIAVMLGLMGEQPHLTDVATIHDKISTIREQQQLKLNGEYPIDYQIDLCTRQKY